MIANKKKFGFSLIELMLVIAIAAILSSIAIPSYRNHLNKVRITEILNIMSYHKIQIADAIAKNEVINKSYHKPTTLISKLTIQTMQPNTSYKIQAIANQEELKLQHQENKPLIINLLAEVENDLLAWECQIQAGFPVEINNCQALELAPNVD